VLTVSVPEEETFSMKTLSMKSSQEETSVPMKASQLQAHRHPPVFSFSFDGDELNRGVDEPNPELDLDCEKRT